MKQLSPVVIACLLFTACNFPIKKYRTIVYRTQVELSNGGLKQANIEDTTGYTTAAEAYAQAARSFFYYRDFCRQNTEDKVTNFDVFDESGLSIKERLPLQLKDSINVTEREEAFKAAALAANAKNRRDDDTAIGPIKFGSEKNYPGQKAEFVSSLKQDRSGYLLGDFRFATITPKFYRNQLYLLSLGTEAVKYTEYTPRVTESVKALRQAISSMYGEPEQDNNIPERLQVQSEPGYLVSRWLIRDRLAEIRIYSVAGGYTVNLVSYQANIKELADAGEAAKSSSLTSN